MSVHAYGGERYEGLKPESGSLTQAYKLAPDFRCDRKSRPAHLLFKHGDVMAVTLTSEVTVCDCERVCWAVKHTRGQRATASVSQSQPKKKKGSRGRCCCPHLKTEMPDLKLINPD